MKRPLLTAAALLLSFPAAASGRSGADAPLPFVTVAKGTQSAWPNGEAFYVVKSQNLWRRIWALHSPGTSPPFVDFSSEDVYAVFAGPKPMTGYDVETVGLNDTGSTVHWDIHGIQPGASCVVSPTPTSPFHFVKAPKTNLLALIFVVNEIVRC